MYPPADEKDQAYKKSRFVVRKWGLGQLFDSKFPLDVNLVLDLGDLLALIRLTEIERHHIQQAINGDDVSERNNAGEVIVQVDNLAVKLKEMYEAQGNEASQYPKYVDYMEIIKQQLSIKG